MQPRINSGCASEPCESKEDIERVSEHSTRPTGQTYRAVLQIHGFRQKVDSDRGLPCAIGHIRSACQLAHSNPLCIAHEHPTHTRLKLHGRDTPNVCLGALSLSLSHSSTCTSALSLLQRSSATVERVGSWRTWYVLSNESYINRVMSEVLPTARRGGAKAGGWGQPSTHLCRQTFDDY
jgi:hypothetical protein